MSLREDVFHSLGKVHFPSNTTFSIALLCVIGIVDSAYDNGTTKTATKKQQKIPIKDSFFLISI